MDRVRRNVLVVHPLLPRPDHSCGDHVTTQIIHLLRRAGHAVTVLGCERWLDLEQNARCRLPLEAWGCDVHEALLPDTVGHPWGQQILQERLRALLDRAHFDALLVSHWNFARDLLPFLRKAAPDVRVVVHSVDAGYLREARGAALAGRLSALKRVVPLRRFELETYADADAVLAVTDADHDVILAGMHAERAKRGGAAAPRPLPPVFTVPFSYPIAPSPAGWQARRDVVFVGFFVHQPNVDAVRYLVREIWPAASRQLPGARLKIVGGHAPEAVRQLASPTVEILGHVPDAELKDLLATARVSIAPLRFGAGLKGKVLQAMAAGLPVVTTPCGIEGIPAEDGRHALVRRDAAGLARALVRAYRERALWERLAAGGRALMAARFSDAAVAAPLFWSLFGEPPAAAPAPPLPAATMALAALLDGLEWQQILGTPSLAYACFVEAGRLDPTLAAAPLAEARLALELDDLPRAAEACDRARRLAPDGPGVLAVTAHLLADRGRTTAARRAAERALALDPQNADAAVVLARIKLGAGQATDALRLLKTAKVQLPDDPAVHRALVEVVAAGGQRETVVSLLLQGRALAVSGGHDASVAWYDEELRRLGGAPPDCESTVALPDATAVASGPPEPLASIIVLVHNAPEATRLCLASLRAHTPRAAEVILVDNGSDAETAHLLRDWVERWPATRLITSRENLGFAGGNNLGMAAARGPFVVLVNSDVVVTPGWLERLIACARSHPGCGLVGPVTNNISGPQKLDAVGYDEKTLAGLDEFALALAALHAGQSREHRRAVGFCLLIERGVITRLGGLDPRFGRGNFEDDDYCLRARLAGFTTWIADDCFVHHCGGSSFAAAGIDYRASLHANWEIFKAKWGLPADAAYGASVTLMREDVPRQTLQDLHVPLPASPAPLPPAPLPPPPPPAAGSRSGESPGPTPSGSVAAAPPDLDELVASGERHFQSGRLTEAETLFRSALLVAPAHSRARSDLACVLWQRRDGDAAAAELRRAIESDPGNVDAAWNLKQILVALGRNEEARGLAT